MTFVKQEVASTDIQTSCQITLFYLFDWCKKPYSRMFHAYNSTQRFWEVGGGSQSGHMMAKEALPCTSM